MFFYMAVGEQLYYYSWKMDGANINIFYCLIVMQTAPPGRGRLAWREWRHSTRARHGVATLHEDVCKRRVTRIHSATGGHHVA